MCRTGPEFGTQVVFYLFFLRRLIQFRSKNQMDFFGLDQSFVRHRADFHPVPDFVGTSSSPSSFLQKWAMSFCVRTRPCEMKADSDVNRSLFWGLFPSVGGTDQSQCLRVQVSGGIGGQVYACLYPVSHPHSWLSSI